MSSIETFATTVMVLIYTPFCMAYVYQVVKGIRVPGDVMLNDFTGIDIRPKSGERDE